MGNLKMRILIFYIIYIICINREVITKTTNGTSNDLANNIVSDGMNILQLEQIKNYVGIIKRLKSDIKQTSLQNDEEAKRWKESYLHVQKYERDQLESKKQEIKNLNVLIEMTNNLIFNGGLMSTICNSTVNGQSKELEIATTDNSILKEKYKFTFASTELQEVIVKSQQKGITILEETGKTQELLHNDYEELVSQDIANNMDEFPHFAQLLTKILADQGNYIQLMQNYLDEEDNIAEYLNKILEQTRNVHLPVQTNTKPTDLLDNYKKMDEVQKSLIKALEPPLSYVIQNKRRFQLQKHIDSFTISIDPCKCLAEGANISEMVLRCPKGTVTEETLENEMTISCGENVCSDKVSLESCGQFTSSSWSEWRECTEESCLIEAVRERKYRSINGTITSEYEMEGRKNESTAANNSYCFEYDMTWAGVDINDGDDDPETTLLGCQKNCQANPQCNFFTFDGEKKACWLHSSMGSTRHRELHVRAPKYCPTLSGPKPHIMESNKSFEIFLPENSTLEVLVVGGGNGSMGCVIHSIFNIEKADKLSVKVDIGKGGSDTGSGGMTTLEVEGLGTVNAAGGGIPQNSSSPACSSDSDSMGEIQTELPEICGGRIHMMHALPGGVGGVIVHGKKPVPQSFGYEPLGFGAGGDGWSKHGSDGVAVMVLC